MGGTDNNVPWWSEHLNVNDDTDYITQSVNIWHEASNRINKFLTINKTPYIHILQPNQYYPKSKILSKYEKNNLLTFPLYGNPIKKYYHLLKTEEIKTKYFTDQRLLFFNVKETVYSDKCCHFNQLGMEIIIDDIILKNKNLFEKLL